MVAGLLDVGGFPNVTGTTDSREGLALAESGAYDLVLLDMRMPEIDGAEFIRHLRARDLRQQPAIVVLTAQTDTETRRTALQAGARDFIIKPFKIWELLQRVRNALEIQILYRQAQEFNNALEMRVEERTQELHETRVDVIRRLAAAAEFRDNETGQHIARMSVFAHHLALKAGLPESEARSIRDAAPLHDIGKIGIPDAILLKRGKLDGSEWEIMKRHAEIGGEILAGGASPLLDLARVVALTHHEKWDGTGYPHGLKGEAIPIAGRIVAVSDVFDALTSDRPYKPAWAVSDAIAFMLDNSGNHLDPTLVGLFHRELPAILELRERFRDEAPAKQVPPS
ncbi:MAG: response regulator [Rhodospirillaceae bacterium]|nr:MAG: response regulator [Rhodospirillaceae bacterium]